MKSLAYSKAKRANCRRKNKEREALWWNYRHGGLAPHPTDFGGRGLEGLSHDAAIARTAVMVVQRRQVDYAELGRVLGVDAAEAEQRVDEYIYFNGRADEQPGTDLLGHPDELMAAMGPSARRAVRHEAAALAILSLLAWLQELLLLLLSLLGTTPQPAAVSTGEARSGAPPGRARRRRRQAVALCQRAASTTKEAGHVGRLHPLRRAEAAI